MSSWRRSRRWTCRSCRSRSRSTLPSRLCWLTLQQIKYLCLLLSYTFIQKLLNGHFGFGFGFGVIFRWWVIASSRVIEEDQRRRRRRRRQRQRRRRRRPRWRRRWRRRRGLDDVVVFDFFRPRHSVIPELWRHKSGSRWPRDSRVRGSKRGPQWRLLQS